MAIQEDSGKPHQWNQRDSAQSARLFASTGTIRLPLNRQQLGDEYDNNVTRFSTDGDSPRLAKGVERIPTVEFRELQIQ